MLNLKSKKNKNTKVNNLMDSLSRNPKILEVDLLKDEMREGFDLARHGKTLLFALLVASLFILEIYLGLNWWSTYEKKRLAETESRFNAVSKEIRDMKNESDQIAAFRQRVELAESLLNRHIYWSNFFTWLEQSTLSSVSYQAFSGKNDGKYELEASTRAFRDVSWQARLFLADPLVKSVKINQSSGERDFASPDNSNSENNISFSISLEINPDIFNSSKLE